MKKNGKMPFFRKKGRSLIFSCWFVCFALSLAWVSCDDNGKADVPQYNPGVPVTVTNIEPVTGGISTPIVIHGNNFGTDKTKVKVLFDEREAVVINVTNEYIYALVPKCEGGDTEIRVIVDEQNEGVLTDLRFDYIVSSKVTTIAADYTGELNIMVALGIDDQENLIIVEGGRVMLYSIPENKMVDILSLSIWFANGCYSRDYDYYYVLPKYPQDAALVVLDKKNNWTRDIIYDSEEVMKDAEILQAIAVDEEDNIYIYGISTSGGALLFKVDAESRKITLVRKLSISNGTYMTYNPRDGYVYMSLSGSNRIIRFDPSKEGASDNEWETVTGESGVAGDVDGILSEAVLNQPQGLEFDDENNLYVAGCNSHNVKKIDLDKGIVSTIAGDPKGNSGYVDGEASLSRFTSPVSVAVTRDGIIYVAEYRPAFPAVGWPLVKRLRCVAIQ